MITEEQLAKIRLLALDVDGVMTDGSIIIGQEGELSKHFDARDGMGISLALRHGIQVALITGRHSEIVLHRAMELGISSIYENVVYKGKVLEQASNELDIPLEETAFMGDDLNDLPAFGKAAVTFAPADAAPEVRERAMLVSACNGGHGAVRDVIERILKAKGLWDGIVRSYEIQGQGDRQ
ncbi:HAD family hydrolase [uncultured Acidaminococcus sp.]|jgi:3-deoxy-D-manno-octulosonate 8-phosphate phosphatase (KDO 8-P phosphatase)|uniref:KdsC family phosphatase n=1 Tax=uncultured Acidaminococcus sp. TaxID=352152 RepID=UPI00266F40D8|nr:HAD-IIIA family hydrolase [uncultured Acidaminococcus sp.]